MRRKCGRLKSKFCWEYLYSTQWSIQGPSKSIELYYYSLFSENSIPENICCGVVILKNHILIVLRPVLAHDIQDPFAKFNLTIEDIFALFVLSLWNIENLIPRICYDAGSCIGHFIHSCQHTSIKLSILPFSLPLTLLHGRYSTIYYQIFLLSCTFLLQLRVIFTILLVLSIHYFLFTKESS